MHVIHRALVAIAVATAVAVPAPAGASQVCIENNQLTFSPPLTESNQFGTVRIDYQVLCPDLPGNPPASYGGSTTVPYFGNCVVALIAEGGQSLVLAGTVYAFYRGDAKAMLMQPDTVCPTTRTHGTGVRVLP